MKVRDSGVIRYIEVWKLRRAYLTNYATHYRIEIDTFILLAC